MNLSNLSIDIESTKLARKLRAVAKHAEQLADELDGIDNAWQCDCGSDECQEDRWNNVRTCLKCGEKYVLYNDLPTRLEGSE